MTMYENNLQERGRVTSSSFQRKLNASSSNKNATNVRELLKAFWGSSGVVQSVNLKINQEIWVLLFTSYVLLNKYLSIFDWDLSPQLENGAFNADS